MTTEEFYAELPKLFKAGYRPYVLANGEVSLLSPEGIYFSPVRALVYLNTGTFFVFGQDHLAARAIGLVEDAKGISAATNYFDHPERPRLLQALGLREPA